MDKLSIDTKEMVVDVYNKINFFDITKKVYEYKHKKTNELVKEYYSEVLNKLKDSLIGKYIKYNHSFGLDYVHVKDVIYDVDEFRFKMIYDGYHFSGEYFNRLYDEQHKNNNKLCCCKEIKLKSDEEINVSYIISGEQMLFDEDFVEITEEQYNKEINEYINKLLFSKCG